MALSMVCKRCNFSSFHRYFDRTFENIHRQNVINVRKYCLRTTFQVIPLLSGASQKSGCKTSRGTVWTKGRYWYSKDVKNEECVDLTFEDVQNLKKFEPTLVVDVREPTELVEFGQYEDAVNIPLGQLEGALKLSEKEFRQRFGVEKPSVANENVVFCCLAGIRSLKAVHIASKLGFLRAKHYKGGWEDYHKRMGLPFKRTSSS